MKKNKPELSYRLDISQVRTKKRIALMIQVFEQGTNNKMGADIVCVSMSYYGTVIDRLMEIYNVTLINNIQIEKEA